MTMFIHFSCLCLLGLPIKLNFNISKVAYSVTSVSSVFLSVLKNQHFQIPIDPGMHGHFWTSSCELLGASWVNKLLTLHVHYITLHCIALHYITLHYITLHYFTLHYITLHYFTLHYIIFTSCFEGTKHAFHCPFLSLQTCNTETIP